MRQTNIMNMEDGLMCPSHPCVQVEPVHDFRCTMHVNKTIVYEDIALAQKASPLFLDCFVLFRWCHGDNKSYKVSVLGNHLHLPTKSKQTKENLATTSLLLQKLWLGFVGLPWSRVPVTGNNGNRMSYWMWIRGYKNSAKSIPQTFETLKIDGYNHHCLHKFSVKSSN